ncbi:MAG TPA: helix-turn-helix domain-containing protein [Mucilaginibacter sp.]|jgi:excisionase family DNA binding protein
MQQTISMIDSGKLDELILEVRKLLSMKADPGNENDVLTLEAAAEYLGVSRWTLYQQTSKKLIKHFKKGRRCYFTRADLAAFARGEVPGRE